MDGFTNYLECNFSPFERKFQITCLTIMEGKLSYDWELAAFHEYPLAVAKLFLRILQKENMCTIRDYGTRLQAIEFSPRLRDRFPDWFITATLNLWPNAMARWSRFKPTEPTGIGNFISIALGAVNEQGRIHAWAYYRLHSNKHRVYNYVLVTLIDRTDVKSGWSSAGPMTKFRDLASLRGCFESRLSAL